VISELGERTMASRSTTTIIVELRPVRDAVRVCAGRARSAPPSSQRASFEGLETFEAAWGFDSTIAAFLLRSLAHRSRVPRNGEPGNRNERLEFLGDSVLGLSRDAYGLRALPSFRRPALRGARRRSGLRRLAELAIELDLGAHLLSQR